MWTTGTDYIGACVIVGRCANYVLRDRQDVLRVFVHANQELRIRRIAERSVLSVGEARKSMEAVDKRRKRYYKQHTGQSWGNADQYHVVANTGLLRIDEVIGMLQAIYEMED